MAIVKIVPMPGPGGDGTPGNTGNFVFNENNMSTNEDMTIGVNGVPGTINLSAYAGVDLQFADATGAGLRFPDGTIQTTAYVPGSEIIPLPSFLDYSIGRDHLPVLNSNFGWDSNGLWFGNAINNGPFSSTSYPVFSDFTMQEFDKVVVTFDMQVDDYCSDLGVCVYPTGITPEWAWGSNGTRISAQFNCVNPEIHGMSSSNTGETSDDDIPSPGLYRVIFTYDPNSQTEKNVLEMLFIDGEQLIPHTRLVLNEQFELNGGTYKVGFASDNSSNDEGASNPPYITYMSNLTININNGETIYSNSLKEGYSGQNAAIADFVFNYNSNDQESTMTIHNHDMTIRTTRDDTQDADIELNSADDIWINANDTIELTSANNEVRVITGQGNTWRFNQDGEFELPTSSTHISSGIDGQIIVDSINATFYNFYNDSSSAILENTGVQLPINSDSMWFINNGINSATITFADATTIQTASIYDATSQGTPAIVFAWNTSITKTFEEAFPMTIAGTIYADNNYVAINATDAQWRFDADGNIKFPGQPSNNRTGTGEVLHFGDSTKQSIITGSSPTSINPTAQRLVVAGQDGFDVGPGQGAEGGDIYLWAGQGGGQFGSGGDIKVDAGNAAYNGSGGTVKVRGGHASGPSGESGGFIQIEAGGSNTGMGGYAHVLAGYSNTGYGGSAQLSGGFSNSSNGGQVDIQGGSSYSGNGGDVSIQAGRSLTDGTGGDVSIQTYGSGSIILSGSNGEFLNDDTNPNNQIATLGDITSVGTGDITFSGVRIIGAGTAAGDGSGNGTIELVPDADLETSQYLVIDPTSPNHIHVRAGGQQDESSADLILGGEKTRVQISDSSRNVIISSKQPQQSMAHMNYGSAPEYLDTTDVVTADSSGWTVDVNGTKYLIVSVQDLGGGITRIYAPGAPFVYEGVYNVFSPAFTNEWNFSTNGTLYGPAMGGLIVGGINGQNDSDLNIYSNNAMTITANGGDMNFYMDGGMYIGASDSNNQIIKRSDLNALPSSYFQSVRWTPNFTATGLTFTGTDNTHPTYQSHYVKQGQLVSFWIAIDCATVTNFGTGQLKVDLPFAPLAGTMNHFSGWVFVDETANPDLAGHIIVNADHLPNTQTIDLHYIKSAGGANSPVMEAQLKQNTPAVLTTLTNIYINGTYIADA